MKKIIFTLILIFFMALFSTGAYADSVTKKEAIILTSLQATYSITSILCNNTNLKVVHIFPKGVKMSSQKNYFKNNKKRLAKILKNAQAVISLRSAWAGDPIFPYARMQNIHVIEIDATMPFDHKKSGVPLLKSPPNEYKSSSSSNLLWLSLSNASIMADIISEDLRRLSPKDDKVIQKNLKKLKQDIFKLRTKYELRFAQLESLDIIAMTDDFIYLTENFNIYVAKYFLKPEIMWTDEDLKDFKQSIIDNDIKVVINKWEPKKEIVDIFKQTGTKLVVLNSMDPVYNDDDGINKEDYLGIMTKNLSALAEAL